MDGIVCKWCDNFTQNTKQCSHCSAWLNNPTLLRTSGGLGNGNITHFRELNGKKVAVTDKGKVLDMKDTPYHNDPLGYKYTGLAAKDSEYDAKTKTYSKLTRKGKSFPTRSDFKDLG